MGGGRNLGFLAWSYAAWRLRKEMPWVAFGLVVFIGAYLPVSNLLIPMGTIMAERVLYIPSAGFLIALAPTVCVLLSGKDWRIAAALLVGVCVLFGALTLKRNHEWGDALRFWRRTAEVSPNSARALRVYGQALIELGTGSAKPFEPLKKSVAIYPVYELRLGGFRHRADAKRRCGRRRNFLGSAPCGSTTRTPEAHLAGKRCTMER